MPRGASPKPRGAASPRWRGGLYTTVKGYRMHRESGRFEHVIIAERALGKPLPERARIHHIDGDRAHNENSNFVICEDASYHMLLHARQRALEACGNPNWRRCRVCGQWDAPERLRLQPNGREAPRYQHPGCKRKNNPGGTQQCPALH